MLVAWGQFAQSIGLVEAIESLTLHQKGVRHQPQTKILEFLVAILGTVQKPGELDLHFEFDSEVFPGDFSCKRGDLPRFDLKIGRKRRKCSFKKPFGGSLRHKCPRLSSIVCESVNLT
jgi:hypothetical protein